MDNRRSQWIALDSMFFGGKTHDALMTKFGPAGVCVWVAYLCACKRNLVPGQISVISEADALAQMGLSSLKLVDQDGGAWELDALWTHLGRVKNVSRRRRGRVTDIVCTRWEQWQYAQRTQSKAESMRRSRAENTTTKDPQSDHDVSTDRDSDRDSERDIDSDTQSLSTLSLVGDDVGRDPRIVSALGLLADADVEYGDMCGDGIRPEAKASYRRKCLATRTRDHATTLEAIASEHPTDTPQRLCERLAEEGFLAS